MAPIKRIAYISVHGCPYRRLGEKDAGGMNVYILAMAKELGKMGISVDVYTRVHDVNGPQVFELGENARVIHLQAGPLDEEKNDIYQHIPTFTAELIRYAEANDLHYDLIHSHYWLSSDVSAELKKRWNIPVITMFHTVAELKKMSRWGEQEPDIRLEVERRAMKDSDLIITSNPDDRAHLMRLFDVESNRLVVLPCGIDTERFKPVDRDKARKELSIQAKDKVLIFVGRLEPLKGIDTILMAIADIADKSNLKFLIVGGNPDTDPEASRLLGIAKTLKIDRLVTFTGSVSHEKLATYYSAADVCLVPSYYESFGLVAVEAMACGTPVIASMVGGLKTTVVDGHNGYLIPWRCPEAFTERIEMLINNRPLRDSLGNQAKESIERLVWDRVAEQVLSAYQSCLDKYMEPAGTA